MKILPHSHRLQIFQSFCWLGGSFIVPNLSWHHPQFIFHYFQNCIAATSCIHADLINFITLDTNLHSSQNSPILFLTLPFLDSLSPSQETNYPPISIHIAMESHTIPHPTQYPVRTSTPSLNTCSKDKSFYSRSSEMSLFLMKWGFTLAIFHGALHFPHICFHTSFAQAE